MTQITGSSNLGISMISIMMVIGLVLFIAATRQPGVSKSKAAAK